MSRPTFRRLISSPALGYCCPWAFFHYNTRRTALLAARLGLVTRAVRKHKALWRCGDYECERAEGCIKKKLKRR